jgi:hypothetical protein
MECPCFMALALGASTRDYLRDEPSVHIAVTSHQTRHVSVRCFEEPIRGLCQQEIPAGMAQALRAQLCGCDAS